MPGDRVLVYTRHAVQPVSSRFTEGQRKQRAFRSLHSPNTRYTTMKLSRRNRFATALLALFSVLFMQLAVAAYACPGISTALVPVEAQAMMSHQDMEGCEGMPDKDLPSLCFAKSQEGTQSLDKPASPALAQLVSVVLITFVGIDTRLQQPDTQWRTELDAPPPSGAPPLSILHCCFRI
jgi:hypothetical protein